MRLTGSQDSLLNMLMELRSLLNVLGPSENLILASCRRQFGVIEVKK